MPTAMATANPSVNVSAKPHQALARTWRPRDFQSLVGQEHVVRALSHALDTGRLHHAYLFTGTRGVGKTTVSRILARALNCETGVSSRPCGQCGACVAIEQGRFPDYVEMDAASNRGVEEMAHLLEQVVYSPVSGRYKVYMIDEVHMLSGHAFNAMLKTLEEPPAHVVFILATTDPRKVPVTVLSRCLQFNLKNLPPALIARHLATVLEAESVPFEPAALAQIGRAAAGSMRDALSLLDQAIAHGGGLIEDSAVREMLGVVDRRDLERLLEALVAGDGRALVELADDMLSGNAPFERALLDFAALLQRIALAQVGAITADDEDGAVALGWASRVDALALQVWYQIAIHGARDLPLAPDAHAGFSMVLLRLLAFRPESAGAGAPQPALTRPAAPTAAPPIAAPPTAAAPQARTPAAQSLAAGLASSVASHAPAMPASGTPESSAAATVPFDGDWTALAAAVTAGLQGRAGLVGQFMQQSELLGFDATTDTFSLRVPVRPLAEPALLGKVRERLAQHFGRPMKLAVEIGTVRGTTVAAVRNREQAQANAQAHANIEGDAFVQTLLTSFDGTILPESIQPLRPTGDPTP
ncbi:MAG: DNA polymerase III subunit gamma/tau [Burkholderiales bacterium]